jgi:hypothetical protein
MEVLMRFFTILMLLAVMAAAGFGQAVYDTVSVYDIQYVTDPMTDDASPLLGDTLVIKVIAATAPRGLSAGARWSFLAYEGDGGAWKAINVIQHDTSSANAVNTGLGFLLPGDEYYVTGVVEEYSNSTQFAVLIDPDHYPVLLSEGNTIAGPFVVPTGDLEDRSAGEQWESAYVMVENAEVINNSLPYNECSLNDGSGLVELSTWYLGFRDSVQTGTYSYPENGSLINAYGFVRDAYANYTINPEFSSWIEELTFPPTITNLTRSPQVPTDAEAVTVSAKIFDGNGTVSSASLFYSVDMGAYSEVTMSAADSIYSADIPAQSDGAFIRYYIYSIDNDGHSSQMPGDTSQATLFYFVRNAGTSIYDVQYTPYSNGNSGMEGMEVTVTGIVMTDTLQSSSYYWIQDGSDPWHGIRVLDAASKPMPGDEVTVTGTVQENSLITRIVDVTSFQVNSQNNPLWAARPTTCAEFETGGPMVEALESMLMEFSTLTVSNPFPDDPGNYGEFEFTDGTGYVRVDDYFLTYGGNLDSSYTQDATIETLYGMGYFSYSNSKVLPRNDADVIGLSTTIRTIDREVPAGYALEQNYPNPFNPTTSIRFTVPTTDRVRISVYNLLGQQVAQLMDLQMQPGNYEVNWNGRNSAGTQVASGIYLYRLEAGEFSLTKKMTLIR